MLRSQFPLENYVVFLGLTLREGTGTREMLGFFRWIGLLAAFVYVFDRLTVHPRAMTDEERRLRLAYRISLALAVLLVALPACSVGAGQPHLIPLIPLFLLAAGDRFSDRLRVRWRPAPHPFWVSAAVSTITACLVIAVQGALRAERFHAGADAAARACTADARRLLAKYAHRTVLNGSGSGSLLTAYQRHTTVFAGHPIGIDAAAVMDYQRAGAEEPDLKRFTNEMRTRHRRELVWVLPRDEPPFAGQNIYDLDRWVYSQGFRRDFQEWFELREQTQFYDVYLPKGEIF